MVYNSFLFLQEVDPESLWLYQFQKDLMFFYIKDNEFFLIQRKGKFLEKYYLDFIQNHIDLWVEVFQKGFYTFSLNGNKINVIINNVNHPEYLLFFLNEEDEDPKICQIFFFHDISVIKKELRKIPFWMENILWSSIYKSGTLTLISEIGSKDVEFAMLLAKFKFGDYKYIRVFEPYSLSAEIQKYHLFGDKPGERFLPMHIVPYYHMSLNAIIIKEVSELKREVQDEFLKRVFYKKGREIFWIFTSHFDMERVIESGEFSRELWNMISSNKIVLPPLRKMREYLSLEIEKLLEFFFEKYRKKVKISEEALQKMVSMEWLGNYEEFYKVLQTAFFLCRDGEIQESDIIEINVEKQKRLFDIRINLEELERELILSAFALTGGNQVHMAKALGISRGSLQYKLQKYGIKIYEST